MAAIRTKLVRFSAFRTPGGSKGYLNLMLKATHTHKSSACNGARNSLHGTWKQRRGGCDATRDARRTENRVWYRLGSTGKLPHLCYFITRVLIGIKVAPWNNLQSKLGDMWVDSYQAIAPYHPWEVATKGMTDFLDVFVHVLSARL